MVTKHEEGFSYLPNSLLEVLMNSILPPAETKVLTFIARKTYCWHKESDSISLTQFEESLNLSRPTVVKALKLLRLVKLVLLVKKGRSRLACNEYQIDLSSYREKLVKLAELVKNTPKKLVKPNLHTKENYTKEKGNNVPLEKQSQKQVVARLPDEVRQKLFDYASERGSHG